MIFDTYDGWNEFQQPDPPTLHLPVAVPGSGKSWLASNLVITGKIIETAIVSPDDIRQWITDDRANQDENGTVFAIVNRAIDTRIKYKRDIYLDATNLIPKGRKELVAKALDADYKVVVYLWDTPHEVIRERNKNRRYPVPEHVMERMFQRRNEISDIEQWGENGTVEVQRLETIYKGE